MAKIANKHQTVNCSLRGADEVHNRVVLHFGAEGSDTKARRRNARLSTSVYQVPDSPKKASAFKYRI